MNNPPGDLDVTALATALREHWGLRETTLTYARGGFGSHHWLAVDPAGARRFLTVDDLRLQRQAPASPAQATAAFGRLERAFATAAALRHDAGLEFIAAPIPSRDGNVLVRVEPHYSLAVFPYLDGRPFGAGEFDSADQRAAVLGLLVRLHRATPAVRRLAGSEDFELPCRADLVRALRELDHAWTGGPYSEGARHLLARNAETLQTQLGAYDRLVAAASADEVPCVITHGEPHSANLMETENGLALIDWDTALLGPPERDLWMVESPDHAELDAYTEATGIRVDPARLELYARWWELAEIGSYVSKFRASHTDNEDASYAWEDLLDCMRSCCRRGESG